MSQIHKQFEDFIDFVIKDELIPIPEIVQGSYNSIDRLEEHFDGIIILYDHIKKVPVYFNQKGLNYLGINKSQLGRMGIYSYIDKFLHFDNRSLLSSYMDFFVLHPDSPMSSVARVKDFNNQWNYIFFTYKAISKNKDGHVNWLLGLAKNVADIVNNQEFNGTVKSSKPKSNIKNLTEREKQIIRLMAKEKTSIQIGKELNLSPLTVNTQRKHIAKKLQVKGAIGIITYALKNGII